MNPIIVIAITAILLIENIVVSELIYISLEQVSCFWSSWNDGQEAQISTLEPAAMADIRIEPSVSVGS